MSNSFSFPQIGSKDRVQKKEKRALEMHGCSECDLWKDRDWGAGVICGVVSILRAQDWTQQGLLLSLGQITENPTGFRLLMTVT